MGALNRAQFFAVPLLHTKAVRYNNTLEGKSIQLGSGSDRGRNINSPCSPAVLTHESDATSFNICPEVNNIARQVHRCKIPATPDERERSGRTFFLLIRRLRRKPIQNVSETKDKGQHSSKQMTIGEVLTVSRPHAAVRFEYVNEYRANYATTADENGSRPIGHLDATARRFATVLLSNVLTGVFKKQSNVGRARTH